MSISTTDAGGTKQDLVLSGDVIDVIRAQAAAAHPDECCGILLGMGGAIVSALPAANVHPEPRRHFEIDPQALIDAHRAARRGGPQVAGYYHSHPAGPARPSATDAALASGDGSVWAIASRENDVTFWRDGEHGFAALSYCIDGS